MTIPLISPLLTMVQMKKKPREPTKSGCFCSTTTEVGGNRLLLELVHGELSPKQARIFTPFESTIPGVQGFLDASVGSMVGGVKCFHIRRNQF